MRSQALAPIPCADLLGRGRFDCNGRAIHTSMTRALGSTFRRHARFIEGELGPFPFRVDHLCPMPYNPFISPRVFFADGSRACRVCLPSFSRLLSLRSLTPIHVPKRIGTSMPSAPV